MIMFEDFTIANGGTEGTFEVPASYRLVGLVVPTMTSTTLTISVSPDGGTTFYATWAAAANGVVGGAAFTTARMQYIPEDLSLLTPGSQVKLTVAAQGAARSLRAIMITH